MKNMYLQYFYGIEIFWGLKNTTFEDCFSFTDNICTISPWFHKYTYVQWQNAFVLDIFKVRILF